MHGLPESEFQPITCKLRWVDGVDHLYPPLKDFVDIVVMAVLIQNITFYMIVLRSHLSETAFLPCLIQLYLNSHKCHVNTILCPTNTKAAKLANKFIGILFKARDQIDERTPVQNIVDSFATFN